MRKFICISVIIFGMSFFDCVYCQKVKNDFNSSEKQIIETLKSFYKEYITENDKMPFDEKKLNLIKRKYCTMRLIKKIDKDDLDYDPLVNAQDFDSEWLKTMKIKRDSKKANTYVVCFMDRYNKASFCLKLFVLKENEGFKIDKVY